MNIKLIHSIALISIVIMHCTLSYGSVIDTYTDEDKQIIRDYLLNDTEKSIEETDIKNYIVYKILNGTSAVEIKNAYKMIYKLTDLHKLYFEPVLIEKIKQTFNSASLTYRSEIIEGNVILLYSFYPLGIIRTESSIDFLLRLIESEDKWSDTLKDGILKNADRKLLVPEIRNNAMGALLQPKDEKGRELLVAIEKKINSFNDSDTYKISMIESLERWKKIYSSGTERFNEMK